MHYRGFRQERYRGTALSEAHYSGGYLYSKSVIRFPSKKSSGFTNIKLHVCCAPVTYGVNVHLKQRIILRRLAQKTYMLSAKGR
jgi:hypothetical protein